MRAGPDGAWQASLRSATRPWISEIARQGGRQSRRAAAGFSTRRDPDELLEWIGRSSGAPRPRWGRWLSGCAVRPALWLVDTPRAPTSHDVVLASAAAWAAARRSEHTGTLDPFATGLLVVLVGRATRLAAYLTALDKTYLATVRTGFTSATGDPEGPVEPAGEPATAAAIGDALPAFTGRQVRVPPTRPSRSPASALPAGAPGRGGGRAGARSRSAGWRPRTATGSPPLEE